MISYKPLLHILVDKNMKLSTVCKEAGLSYRIVTKIYNNENLTIETIEKLLDGKPEQTEIILTGRDAPLSFIKRAAYVSEIKKVKHPMDEGVKARRSIEY